MISFELPIVQGSTSLQAGPCEAWKALWPQTPALTVSFVFSFVSAELLWWLVVGNPNAPDRFWLLSFLLLRGTMQQTTQIWIWLAEGRIQQKAPTSPPLSIFNVSSNPESSLTQKSLGRWSVVPNFPLSRSQSGFSSRSLHWTAYWHVLRGSFLIDFATHTLKKIWKTLPPQTSTFPCEAIHPGVDLPSLPNQIFFEKIS